MSESVWMVQTVKRKTLQKIASKKKNQVERWRQRGEGINMGREIE